MDVYILNLILTNQKNEKNQKDQKLQSGIHFKNLYPLIIQDRFLNINSKSGAYSAIERMKKDGLIEITRIKKIPPEIIISLKKKGLDELKEFSKILPKSKSERKTELQTQIPIQSQDQVKSLTLSLEKSKTKLQSISQALEQSRSQVESLKQSLEQSQSQKILPKKTNIEKKMVDLDDDEYDKRVKRIKEKIIDGLNMDEEDFSKEQLETMEETAEEILVLARK